MDKPNVLRDTFFGSALKELLLNDLGKMRTAKEALQKP